MTKTDIKKLLGTPEFKNGDLEGEQWGYHKMIGDVAGPEPVLFLVTFDNEGKVIAYDTVKEHHHPISYYVCNRKPRKRKMKTVERRSRGLSAPCR